jgi:hypothetical protein
MKRKLAIASMCLGLLPFGPLSSVAQGRDHGGRHRGYRLVDLGTLGGPASYFSSNYIGGVSLNKAGAATGSADTAERDPNTPNCDRPDCFIDHAFRWEDGKMTDLGALVPDAISKPAQSMTGVGSSAHRRMV